MKSDENAARTRKRKARVLTNKLASLDKEPSTLSDAEEHTALMAAFNRLTPAEIIQIAQPFKDSFWEMLTVELNICEYLKRVPSDVLYLAIMDVASDKLKREQKVCLERKQARWKLEVEIYKLAALHVRLNIPVFVVDRLRGRRPFRIVKISKTNGVELEDGRKFKKVHNWGAQPVMTLGASNLRFDNCYAWHQTLETYFSDEILGIILMYNNGE